MSEVCKECGKPFDSERALHCHLKEHGMYMADYYVKHFARKSLLTGELLPFKDKKSYFENDFADYGELKKWCVSAKPEEVKEYALESLKKRVESRSLSRGPGHLELNINRMPDLDVYIKSFGSYSEACSLSGVRPLFFKRMPKDFFNCDASGMKIFVDTREQKPLSFPQSTTMALDAGDYTAAGDFYDRTYIDRKSPSDFISTLSLSNLDRFKRELERIREMDSYLFIVTECSLSYLEKYIRAAKTKKFGPSKTNLKFIYHNMRELFHEFEDRCQFIFTGSRENSELIIPRILFFGSILWNVDLQYYLEKNELV